MAGLIVGAASKLPHASTRLTRRPFGYERRVRRLIARYGRLDLLLVDELGYAKLDSRSAELLLFQTLTERDEKSSVGVASNLSSR